MSVPAILGWVAAGLTLGFLAAVVYLVLVVLTFHGA